MTSLTGSGDARSNLSFNEKTLDSIE